MNHITHELGEKKPIFYTTYFFLKNIAISAALGALVGRVLKWYTPSHGAIMGAFSGAVSCSGGRVFGNQCIYIQQLAENNLNGQARQIQESAIALFNIGAISVFAYLGAPLAANWFQKPTTLRLAFQFHLSSSLMGHFALSQLQQALFARMSENSHGIWLENWAEKEWLTRTSSGLPPVHAKIRWENFARTPKTIALDEKTPNSTASQWKDLCNKIDWRGRNSPFSTIKSALRCIDKEAVTDTTYRYTQNLLAQLYLRLAQEKDPEKRKSNLIFLEQELRPGLLTGHRAKPGDLIKNLV